MAKNGCQEICFEDKVRTYKKQQVISLAVDGLLCRYGKCITAVSKRKEPEWLFSRRDTPRSKEFQKRGYASRVK